MSDESFEKLLEHVKAIRESLEPKPAPPSPPAPTGFIAEFQARAGFNPNFLKHIDETTFRWHFE